MKRYTITITSTEVEDIHTKSEWTVVGTKDDGNKKYDYTPQIKIKQEVTRTLFTQTLGGKLNLMAVIKAFNGEMK